MHSCDVLYGGDRAGVRPFLIWVACVIFIIFALDNFLLRQPNNSRRSTANSKNILLRIIGLVIPQVILLYSFLRTIYRFITRHSCTGRHCCVLAMGILSVRLSVCHDPVVYQAQVR